MISYAQNFEDVILSRVLADVTHGCYIDVGAHDPDVDTVSKAFFEKGWSGVHVEPVASFAHMLREKRPGDVVLQAVVSSLDGLVSIHASDSTGLSTTIAEIAKKHEEKGIAKFTSTHVPSVSLAAIFEKVTNGREIHWLKIDVEGSEADVLNSWGTAEHRPWIVVVESTAPMSTRQTFGAWEHELFKRGYVFAYFDGLNRFYVSSGQVARKEMFEFPPNVFDNFKLAATTTFANQLGEQAKVQQEKVRDQLNQEVLERLALLDSIQQNFATNAALVQSTLDALQENLSDVNSNLAKSRTQTENNISLEIRSVVDATRRALLDSIQENLSDVNSNLAKSRTQTENNISLEIRGLVDVTRKARDEETELITNKIDEVSNAGFLQFDRFGKTLFTTIQTLSQELSLLRREGGEKLEKHKEMLKEKDLRTDQLLKLIHHLSLESESTSAALESFKKSIIDQKSQMILLAENAAAATEDAKRLREEIEFWRHKSDAYRLSKSWKVTAPLRVAYGWLRRD